MANREGNESCFSQIGEGMSCCRIESLISVDDRGQMVLPKEIREKANIQAGDKLAVISWDKGGTVCCISLIKADNLTGMVKDLLGPMMSDLSSDNLSS
jgi:antitoxin PrlF